MKRNIIQMLGVAAALLLCVTFTYCSREEQDADSGMAGTCPVTITVVDGGYPAAGNGNLQPVTRAEENGYYTKFTAGDEFGLYIVRNGKLVYSNVKVTVEEFNGRLSWETEVELRGAFGDERYFLYYPYRTGDHGVNPDAADETGFFASLISNWQPAADQSAYGDYTASDLMTSNGYMFLSNGVAKLTFIMAHRMAMAVMEIPATEYKFTNTSDGEMPDYTVASSADFSGSTMKPCLVFPGIYRYLMNPASEAAVALEGSYDGGKRKFSVSPSGIASGGYKTYKIDDTVPVEKQHNLQVGDYLLSDGTLVSKDDSLTAGQKAACVAVVFHAGHEENDKSDYSSTGIGNGKCHGYAVALKDITGDYCIWGYDRLSTGSFQQNNYSYPERDWSGYDWTQKIITNGAGGVEKLKEDSFGGYPATYYAVVAYQKGTAAPAGSSGWFLPSIGQLIQVFKNRGTLFSDSEVSTALTVYGRYWSSSEDYRDSERSVIVVYHVNMYGYNIIAQSKINFREYYVRPVLAF